jgi:uncharacterized protein
MYLAISTNRRRVVLPLALLASVCCLIWSRNAGADGSPVPPKPDRYVTDLAGVFPPGRAEALNERLAAFERETSAQVLVYVASKVPDGTTLEELGAAAIRAWGVGQKGKSNGLVFFVFPEERKMRIATGYGLEGPVPDAVAKRIQSDTVKPLFLKGDFAGGIEAGVEALLQAIRGEGTKGTGRTAAESGLGHDAVWDVLRWATWGTLVAVLLVAFFRRSIGAGILGVLAGFAAVFIPLAVFNSPRLLGPAFFLAFGSMGAVMIGAIRQKAVAGSGGRRWRGGGGSGGTWSSTSDSSSSSSSSSSDSSSSSFSGGGGDSGGGGSSDSW